ncbi:MAG: phytoene desaturase family protein [Bacteroidota bacterium]
MKHITIIGSGFAGLSAAAYMAKEGHQVIVIEKNEQAGGRARSFESAGFTFDMGPSWYWMPDIFESFFKDFGKQPNDYYQLIRLDPSYQVLWEDLQLPLPANFTELKAVFESLEKGAGNQLELFLKEAAYKYEVGIHKFVEKPGLSITEFFTLDVAKSVFKIDLLTSIHTHVRKYFSNPKLIQIAEFPILFLGALPKNTPALYSLMNYADMKLGTWYPMGGMTELVKGMQQLAMNLGVQFKFNESVLSFEYQNKSISKIRTDKNTYPTDAVIAACDYHHIETAVLASTYRNYTDDYWEKRKMAPSSILMYLGINKKLKNILHHNLLFDAPFDQHAQELYTQPQWPSDPLMYVNCTSASDPSVAPEGNENLMVLIPTAPGLIDTEEIKDAYFKKAMAKLEKHFGEDIESHIVYKRIYAAKNFIADYHAFKGNAYGLANTLDQTAILKPSIKNKHLHNLIYAGQLTVPGPGVPPAIISGKLAAQLTLKNLNN